MKSFLPKDRASFTATDVDEKEALFTEVYALLDISTNDSNKISFKDHRSPFFYIPPISDVYTFFGFISNPKQLIDLLEKDYGYLLDISRTNKYALFDKGVSLKTARKVIDWCKTLPFSWKALNNKRFMAQITRSCQYGSNAGGWLSCINAFKTTALYKTDHEFFLVVDFLLTRCRNELKARGKVRSNVALKKLTSSSTAELWEIQKELWTSSRCIPLEVIDTFGERIVEYERGSTISKQKHQYFIECYLNLYLDFYLDLITNYDIGLQAVYGEKRSDSKVQMGLLTKSVYSYASNRNIKTCFDAYLKELKGWLDLVIGDTGYRKIATFIDIQEDPSYFSGEAKIEKQYNQLKDWRKGENLPSNERLAKFCDNFAKYVDSNCAAILFDTCKTMIAFDKLILFLSKQAKNEGFTEQELLVIVKRALLNIEKYYTSNLNKYMKERAVTTKVE